MIYNVDSRLLLDHVSPNSIHAVVTDPPYGMGILGNEWDKILPPKEVWDSCFKSLRPGGFLLSFGHTRLYHKVASQLEEVGFVIKDCLCWVYASGFPRSRDLSKILKRAGNPEAEKWSGTGTVLKTAWEPIVLAQKPLEGTLIENAFKWQTGVLNIDQCRIPYESEEDKKSLESFLHFAGKEHGDDRYFSINKGGKKQVNIHPDGRWPSNVLWLDPINADYDKYFIIPKPAESEKKSYNNQDTVKPIELMSHLVKLITLNPFKCGFKPIVMDPFMGSGTTGVACKMTDRDFVGFDNNLAAYEVAQKRIDEKCVLEIFD